MTSPAMPPYDALLVRMYQRVGLDDVGAHLEATYGIGVKHVTSLDVGVLRIDRTDGPPWVARVFAAGRPLERAEGDAAVLAHLAEHGFPAERLAADAPVSSFEGQPVLVTTFVEAAKKAKRDPEGAARIGGLLGRLHALPLPPNGNAAARPAGALHHFAEGTRRDELDEAARWLDQLEPRVPEGDRGRVDQLRQALAEADGGEGLPAALIHPDPVPKNAIRTAPGELSYVDWTGAGIGPRNVSLSYVLGRKTTSAQIVAGYAEHVTLTDEEWERLPGIVAGRHLVNLCFRLGLAPENAAGLAKKVTSIAREARSTVAAARKT
jgi:Ser/Thr protein kinase RdoA (MazF antagonist)